MNHRLHQILRGLLFVLFAVALHAADPYVLPIGVPNPGFGLYQERPPRPAPWDQEIPGYYFVNAATGVDGRAFGSPNAPRRTIPQNPGPGTYIEIEGTYNIDSGAVINFTGAGNGNAWAAGTNGPVWFVGNLENRPRLTNYDSFLRGSYLYLDGLHFEGTGLGMGIESAGFPADHIMVRNCVFHGDSVTRKTAISMNGYSADSRIRDVVVYNNEISHYGPIASSEDVDAHGIQPAQWCSNIWILRNKVHTLSGSGGMIGGLYDRHDPRSTHHGYIADNEFYNCRQSGYWVKMAEHIVISQNHSHHILSGPGGAGCGFGAQYRPLSVWFLANTIHDVQYGIRIASTYNDTYYLYAIGNVIYDAKQVAGQPYGGGGWDEAAIHMYGGTYRYLINNTVYNCSAGMNLNGFTGYYYVENNVIANVTEPNGNHVRVENQAAVSDFRYNLLFQPGGEERIWWGGSPAKSLAQFKLATGKGAHSIVGDPLFVNPAGRNLRIQFNSPARDSAGLDSQLLSNVYATYQQAFGVDIRLDLDRRARPIGNGWDIGAAENDLSVPPAPPKGLRKTN